MKNLKKPIIKKKLSLMIFFLINILFVYGQTFSGRSFLTDKGPSSELFKSAVLTKISKTTFTLSLYSSESDVVDIKHLKCDKKEPTPYERGCGLSWLKSKLYSIEEGGYDYFLITEETKSGINSSYVIVAYFNEMGECLWKVSLFRDL